MDDSASFEEFYRANAARLIGQVALLTGDREEARDCVHEAMERAWIRWRHVSGLNDPASWVRTVAWRQAISRWRRVRTAYLTLAQLRAPEPVRDHAVRISETQVLYAALGQLPIDQRLALVLHHVCDLDVATVAQQTGSSVTATKSRLVRGRRALAELLDGPAPPGSEAEGSSTRPSVADSLTTQSWETIQ